MKRTLLSLVLALGMTIQVGQTGSIPIGHGWDAPIVRIKYCGMPTPGTFSIGDSHSYSAVNVYYPINTDVFRYYGNSQDVYTLRVQKVTPESITLEALPE